MTPPQARRLPFGAKAVTAIGLLLGLAGAFASPEGAPAEGLASRVWIPLPDWLVIGTIAALAIASLILVAMMLSLHRRKRREDEIELYHEPEKIPPVLAAFLILLALLPGLLLGGAIFWLAQSGISVIPGSGRFAAGIRDALLLSTDQEPPARPASPVTTGLFGTLALLAGAGSLGLVLWLFFAGRLSPGSGDAHDPHGELTAAVEDSLEDLRREPDARLAIIKIYRHFERALAGASVPRRPWQTPMEFMRAVLGKLPLPAAAVRRLTALFELARFSRHPVGAADRDSAWRSLIEIRGALDKEREAPDAAAS